MTFAKLAVSSLIVGTSIAAHAGYVNYEVSHVHPIALTPDGNRLLAVNTPDAVLEVFTVAGDGSLTPETAVPVGLEPVTVVARTDTEAWVVNNLSDTVSIVDLTTGTVVETLEAGNEPTDVAFAGTKAFVAVSEEDAVKVYDLTNLDAAPSEVPLFGRDVRALAASGDGTKIYAVVLKSGNLTTVINAFITHTNTEITSGALLEGLGLRGQLCEGVPQGTSPAPYPALPTGIVRNPLLPVPPLGNPPQVGLIVKWNTATQQWEDETGTSWSHCLQYRPADDDLFVIDASTLAVSTVKHLGTSLFEVSVHPSGRIYVPHTEARNFVPATLHATEGSGRFEHLHGVRGRVVNDRFAVVDPGTGNAVTLIDLNGHVDRSVTPGPASERENSISQPGMLVWKADGSAGFLTAIGSRKLFRVKGDCLADDCVFGADRNDPDVVEVGEGPTGVALKEDVPAEGTDRLYVLNRISHSIAVVGATGTTLTKLDEIPLHDPTPAATRDGRRFLYDAIDTSGHGDAACASCHLSGDLDGLAWELGNPEGDFVPYSNTFDNVRFLTVGGASCAPGVPNCSAGTGFDPQKGPMTTQTLRGMLEPLHWRGDRPTMRDFNGAFPDLMGTTSGLPPQDIEAFRQFALAIHFPPNPYRNVDDTLPDATVQVHGMLRPGNPADGEDDFDTANTDGGPCVTCHTHPFGAGGGKLGGVEPEEPTSMDAAALFNGILDLAVPNDVKIPHLRNMHEKFGAVWADRGTMECGGGGVCDNDPDRPCTTDLDCSKPETKTTFGHIHDGSVPDLYRFLSAQVFNVTVQQIDDLVSFLFHFPTSTRPAVGRQVTLAAGTPPTGTTDEETLLSTLMLHGDLADGDRHCELVAHTRSGGQLRGYHLSGGEWVTDVAGEESLTTTQLRESAESAITFTCANIMSGQRLGGDRDEDAVLDGDDCAPADAETWAAPAAIDDLVLSQPGLTRLEWTDQSGDTGPSQRYDVLGGELSTLRASGLDAATSCVEPNVGFAFYFDVRPDPPVGDGYFYLLRANNPCGVGSLGSDRETLESLVCP